jgi:hypothetical protein
MSHLVYITLYGETDGVILSRLDCILVSHYPKPPGGQPQRDFYAFS